MYVIKDSQRFITLALQDQICANVMSNK